MMLVVVITCDDAEYTILLPSLIFDFVLLMIIIIPSSFLSCKWKEKKKSRAGGGGEGGCTVNQGRPRSQSRATRAQ